METLHIIVGFLTRIAAVAGAAFCVFTAVVVQNTFADQVQMIMFLMQVSITGAVLMFFAHRAGKLALDKA